MGPAATTMFLAVRSLLVLVAGVGPGVPGVVLGRRGRARPPQRCRGSRRAVRGRASRRPAPFPGRDDGRTAFAEGVEVAPGRRVGQHVGVHRGRDEGRGPDGEVEGGEEVVGEAERQAGDDVGGGGGHHEDVGLLGERDVADAAGGVGSGGVGRFGGGVGKQVFEDRLAGDGGERERGDELAGGAGQDDLDPEAALPEGPHQVRRLVGPDAPGDAEDDLFLHPLILGGTPVFRPASWRGKGRESCVSPAARAPGPRQRKPRTANPCGGRAARERQSSDWHRPRSGATAYRHPSRSAGTAWNADLRAVLPVGPGTARRRRADDVNPTHPHGARQRPGDREERDAATHQRMRDGSQEPS